MFYLNLAETNTCWRCQNETGIHSYFTRFLLFWGSLVYVFVKPPQLVTIHVLWLFCFTFHFTCSVHIFLHVGILFSLSSTLDQPDTVDRSHRTNLCGGLLCSSTKTKTVAVLQTSLFSSWSLLQEAYAGNCASLHIKHTVIFLSHTNKINNQVFMGHCTKKILKFKT